MLAPAATSQLPAIAGSRTVPFHKSIWVSWTLLPGELYAADDESGSSRDLCSSRVLPRQFGPREGKPTCRPQSIKLADSAGSRDALTNHDSAIQLGVSGAIHGAHAALARESFDVEATAENRSRVHVRPAQRYAVLKPSSRQVPSCSTRSLQSMR